MSIKLVVDSSCDLPANIIEKFKIDILPLNILEGDKEYKDKLEISSVELYKNMRKGKIYKTSQVSPDRMFELFIEYAKKEEEVIYLALSSGLSGQFQTAKLVAGEVLKTYPNFKIDIIDTRSAASGIGLIAYELAKMIDENLKKEIILEKTMDLIDRINHLIIVDSMDYLYKGGRISPVKALAGNLLNIKPIISIDELGRLEFKNKIRGKNKLLKSIKNKMKILSDFEEDNSIIGLVYGDNEGLAEEVKDMLVTEFKPKELLISNIGATISAHTGPDIIGITFFTDKT